MPGDSRIVGNRLGGVEVMWSKVPVTQQELCSWWGPCAVKGIIAFKMSEASVSTNSSAEEWGEDDPVVNVEGVHTTVLRGLPVWPLVLHHLVMVSNCRVYLEHCLVQVDFVALPLEPRLVGAQFLREGCDVDWANCRIMPDQADRILAALGLLYMMVKCMIFNDGGDYDTKVSGASDWRWR